MKTAIYGLVRGHNKRYQYIKVIRRNRLLNQNLSGSYDMIIFHEGDLDEDHLDLIRGESQNVRFINVGDSSFRVPDHISKKNIPNDRFGIGYRHMCQFSAIDVWKYLRQYDYVMGLDDDGWIESSVKYNIFEYCRQNNYKFCYIDRSGDGHQPTVATLPEFTREYVIKNDININCSLEDIHLDDAIITHIFITDVSFWQRDDVQKYLEAVSKSGGIYKYRWGDASIMSLAVKMFMEEKYVSKLDFFQYTHGNHNFSNYNKQQLTNIFRRSRLLRKMLISGLSLPESIYWRAWQLKQEYYNE
jgi:hypothetical protein